MTQLFANNAVSTLATGIASDDLALTVASGHGARFPSLADGDYFLATLTQAATESTWEIVKVTGRSTDTLTIVRGQEGTTPAAWLVGDKVELRVTAGAIKRYEGDYGRDTVPASPTAETEEFNSATRPAKWTQTTNGSPVIKWNEGEAPSCWLVRLNAASEWARLTQAYAPAGNFSVTVKLSILMTGGGTQRVWPIRVLDSSEQEGVAIIFDNSGGPLRVYGIAITGGSNNLIGTTITPVDRAFAHYVHIQRGAANTWTLLHSYDGQTWRIITNNTVKGLTVAKVDLFPDENNAADEMAAAWDWVRFDQFTYTA